MKTILVVGHHQASYLEDLKLAMAAWDAEIEIASVDELPEANEDTIKQLQCLTGLSNKQVQEKLLIPEKCDFPYQAPQTRRERRAQERRNKKW